MSTNPSVSNEKPHIEIDTQNYTMSDWESDKLDSGLDPLRRVIHQFPKSDLYITVICHPRAKDFHVKTSLLLPGKTLFTGERGVEMIACFLRCVPKLVHKVVAYKSQLNEEDDKRKQSEGTRRDIAPGLPCDLEAVDRAVDEGDYEGFRRATSMYEEPVRLRAGRWVQRYPEANARIGNDIKVADLVEEVFLNAFEHYREMPRERRMSEWIEGWIDPSLRALMDHPDEELENVNFAWTYRETEEP